MSFDLRISRRNGRLCFAGAVVGLGFSYLTAKVIYSSPPFVQFGALIGAAAFWGLSVGAFLGNPWRGFLIASASAGSTLLAYMSQIPI